MKKDEVDKNVMFFKIKSAGEMRQLGSILMKGLLSNTASANDVVSSTIISMHGPAGTGKTTFVEGMDINIPYDSFDSWDRRFPLTGEVGGKKCKVIDNGTTSNPLSGGNKKKVLENMQNMGEDFTPFEYDKGADITLFEHGNFPHALLSDCCVIMGNFEGRPDDTATYFAKLGEAFESIAVDGRGKAISFIERLALRAEEEKVKQSLGIKGFCPNVMKKQFKEAMNEAAKRVNGLINERKSFMLDSVLPTIKNFGAMPLTDNAGRMVCIAFAPDNPAADKISDALKNSGIKTLSPN